MSPPSSRESYNPQSRRRAQPITPFRQGQPPRLSQLDVEPAVFSSDGDWTFTVFFDQEGEYEAIATRSADGLPAVRLGTVDGNAVGSVKVGRARLAIRTDGLSELELEDVIREIPVIGSPQRFAPVPDPPLGFSPTAVFLESLVDIGSGVVIHETTPSLSFSTGSAPSIVVTFDHGASLLLACGHPESNPLIEGALHVHNPRLEVFDGRPVVVGSAQGWIAQAMWHQRGVFWHLLASGETAAVDEIRERAKTAIGRLDRS